MKKLILMFAAMVLLAAPVMADPMPPVNFHYPTLSGAEYTAVATVRLGWDGVWHGGSFTVNLVNGSLLPDVAPFETFCVESEITFSPGAVYYASINDVAIRGRPTVSQEALTPEAAWIYSQFRAGALGGYTDRQISEAIWYQQDATMPGGVNNALSVAAQAHASDGIGNVRVLNLWTLRQDGTEWVASDVQSQLILVPAPAAIGLGVLGLALVGWLKRRVG